MTHINKHEEAEQGSRIPERNAPPGAPEVIRGNHKERMRGLLPDVLRETRFPDSLPERENDREIADTKEAQRVREFLLGNPNSIESMPSIHEAPQSHRKSLSLKDIAFVETARAGAFLTLTGLLGGQLIPPIAAAHAAYGSIAMLGAPMVAGSGLYLLGRWASKAWKTRPDGVLKNLAFGLASPLAIPLGYASRLFRK